MLKPEDVLDDETALSIQLREAQTKLRETESASTMLAAQLEAVEAVLRGQPVSDFMTSFPLIASAQELFVRANTPEPLRYDVVKEDEYWRCTLYEGAVVRASGTSRNRLKAVAYALEQLAADFENLAAPRTP